MDLLCFLIYKKNREKAGQLSMILFNFGGLNMCNNICWEQGTKTLKMSYYYRSSNIFSSKNPFNIEILRKGKDIKKLNVTTNLKIMFSELTMPHCLHLV